MTSFVHVESGNNDIFRKAGGNFNMMLIWWMYDDFTQNGWENRQKHMAELRDTLYSSYVKAKDRIIYFRRYMYKRKINKNFFRQ